MTHVLDLRCDQCSARWPADKLVLLCPNCSGVLDAEYDRDAMARNISLERICARRPGVWRWREFLPVADERHFVDIGAGASPLVECPQLSAWIGARVFVKYEGQQPTGSLKDLKAEAARVKRRAFGEASVREREARAHRRRYCRIWSPTEGGVRLDAWLPTVDGARVKAALDKETDRVFKEAWAAGIRDRPDAYRADALVRAVRGDGSLPAQVAVRVDAGTLRRGFVEGDEVCEIPGVGPIPVDTARDLLGDAAFHVVVTDGVDVKAVTSKKRTIPAALRRALIERDQTCAVPGCDATHHLQIDHRWDFSKGGPTSLSNLSRLCPPHHRMKTTMGFRLVEMDGVVRWVGPSG